MRPWVESDSGSSQTTHLECSGSSTAWKLHSGATVVLRTRPLSCRTLESKRAAYRPTVLCVEGWKDWPAGRVSSSPDGFPPDPPAASPPYRIPSPHLCLRYSRACSLIRPYLG